MHNALKTDILNYLANLKIYILEESAVNYKEVYICI